MKRYSLILMVCTVSVCLYAQLDFKYDNVDYKMMYPAELYNYLQTNPGTLLIDVRSAGEYADTSQFGSLNIGRLKGSVNINIDSMEFKLETIKAYKDKPIVLYCSHSQRSRRVGKLLHENGFTRVYNLNGGMSWMNQASNKEFPHKKDLIVSSLPYKSIPADETIKLLKHRKDLIILDVRPKAEFMGKDSLESNNLGRLKYAINIPRAFIKDSLAILQKYKDKDILVYDINGAESNHVARYLSENGFKHVNNLLGGLYAIIGKENKSLKTRKKIMENTPAYTLLNAKESIDLILKNKDLVILDTRSLEEFNNKSGMVWKNLGNLKNAINLPANEFKEKLPGLIRGKKAKILIYGSGEIPYNSCKLLREMGYDNVNLVIGGLWNFVSLPANVKGFEQYKYLMVNHEGFY